VYAAASFGSSALCAPEKSGLTGSRASGHALVRALGSVDENLKVVAGMLLVQAGCKAEPALYEALRKREQLPLVLTILGDIGDRSVATDVEHFKDDRDPCVARAARDALRTLGRPAAMES
jgi:hypothetical protein